MKGEHLTRAGFGVAPIGKSGDDSRAFVDEGQSLFVLDPFELGGGVAFCLFLDRRDFVAPFFGLGFDDADGASIDEEHIVGGADVGLVFAHGDTLSGIEVDLVFVLRIPAGRGQLRVDLVAGDLFGVLVLSCRRHWSLRRSAC